MMKRLLAAGFGMLMLALPASAQSTPESLRAQLSNQVMNLRGYTQQSQSPTGERVRIRLFESGAAEMRFDDLEPGWVLWRVNAQNQFCTTYAIPDARGALIAAGDEDCLDFRIEGRQIGLNFYSSSGRIDRYSGTMRPM